MPALHTPTHPHPQQPCQCSGLPRLCASSHAQAHSVTSPFALAHLSHPSKLTIAAAHSAVFLLHHRHRYHHPSIATVMAVAAVMSSPAPMLLPRFALEAASVRPAQVPLHLTSATPSALLLPELVVGARHCWLLHLLAYIWRARARIFGPR